MVVFADSLVKSWFAVKKNWKILPIIAVLDLLFFLLLGMLSSMFRNAAGPYLAAIVSQSGKLTAEVSLALSQHKSGLLVLFSDSIFTTNIKSFIFAAALASIALYVIWAMIQGSAWSFANKIANKNNKDYLSSFSKTSLFWLISILLYFVLLTFFSLITQIRFTPLIPSALIRFFGAAVLLILLYFAFISVSLTPMKLKQNLKKTFSSGIKNIFTFVVAYALIFLVLLLNFQITYFLFKSFISGTSFVSYFFIILRMLIALPFLAWARVYLIETAKN